MELLLCGEIVRVGDGLRWFASVRDVRVQEGVGSHLLYILEIYTIIYRDQVKYNSSGAS